VIDSGTIVVESFGLAELRETTGDDGRVSFVLTVTSNATLAITLTWDSSSGTALRLEIDGVIVPEGCCPRSSPVVASRPVLRGDQLAVAVRVAGSPAKVPFVLQARLE
jgi:hypothetical protein